MNNPAPTVPSALHPLAAEILKELAGKPESRFIILGGGVALQHYCLFRDTTDIDAWWENGAVASAEQVIHDAMSQVAARHNCNLIVRRWGETQSYEFRQGSKKIFSFQISLRTIALEPAVTSSWPPIQLETFRDNLASKMNALVNRGAPRDFIDIYEVCKRELATVQFCWQAWADKNAGLSLEEARANVLRLLEQLESRRPLAGIGDRLERERAQTVRNWVRHELCEAAR